VRFTFLSRAISPKNSPGVVGDAARRAGAARRRFGVAGAQPFVARIFQIIGQAQLLDEFPTTP
jgi:hypothetical protein